MRLYHLTTPLHLPAILDAGELTLTESNVGAPPQLVRAMPGVRFQRIGERVAPSVLWCTDVEDPTDHGMLSSSAGKGLMRFTIQVPDEVAAWWPEWSAARGIDRAWYKVLARAGRPQEWWVVTRPVPASEWEVVERRETLDSSDWEVVG